MSDGQPLTEQLLRMLDPILTDPRLSLYVFYNGMQWWYTDNVFRFKTYGLIETYVGELMMFLLD